MAWCSGMLSGRPAVHARGGPVRWMLAWVVGLACAWLACEGMLARSEAAMLGVAAVVLASVGVGLARRGSSVGA